MILQGGRKWDGLAINGDARHSSIQVPANKPATRTTPMKVTEMSQPSPFFCPPIKPHLARGCAIFSRQGGEIEMRLLRQEVLVSRKTPGMKSDMRAVPTRNSQCHIILHRSLGNNQRQCPMYKVYKRLLKIFRNADYTTMNY